MIVVVLSPSTKGKDMVTKLNLYMKNDILKFWIVDLEGIKLSNTPFPKKEISEV